MASQPSQLLSGNLERVIETLRELLGDSLPELQESLRGVLEDPNQISMERYVGAYRACLKKLEEGLRASLSPVEGSTPEQALAVWSEHGIARIGMVGDFVAADVHCSRWVAAHGAQGIWLEVLQRIRSESLSLPPLALPDPLAAQPVGEKWSAAAAAAFHNHALRVLATAGSTALERVRDALGLSHTELGAMFGVSRQAATQWMAAGDVPSERQEKLTSVAALVDLLEHRLKRERLAGIARRPADAYGGATMLQLIGDDRHNELLRSARRSFDWAILA